MADSYNVVPFPRRRRAPRVANPMTEELASKIKTLVIFKGMAQQTVAAQLGVNQGRYRYPLPVSVGYCLCRPASANSI